MRLTATIGSLLATAVIVGSAPVLAQAHQQHASTAAHTSGHPSEPGQSGFAAIQEIVTILGKDSATDWSRVSIDRLREHLVDMDNVVVRARVQATPVRGGTRFTATGEDDATRKSIRAMIRGHASTPDASTGFKLASADMPQGATLTVTGEGPAARSKNTCAWFLRHPDLRRPPPAASSRNRQRPNGTSLGTADPNRGRRIKPHARLIRRS